MSLKQKSFFLGRTRKQAHLEVFTVEIMCLSMSLSVTVPLLLGWVLVGFGGFLGVKNIKVCLKYGDTQLSGYCAIPLPRN